MGYRIGSRVRSVAVGVRKAFKGRIEMVDGPKKTRYYLVRDKHGALWHRSASELSAVTPRGTTP